MSESYALRFSCPSHGIQTVPAPDVLLSWAARIGTHGTWRFFATCPGGDHRISCVIAPSLAVDLSKAGARYIQAGSGFGPLMAGITSQVAATVTYDGPGPAPQQRTAGEPAGKHRRPAELDDPARRDPRPLSLDDLIDLGLALRTDDEPALTAHVDSALAVVRGQHGMPS